jgi:hypothetical protein
MELKLKPQFAEVIDNPALTDKEKLTFFLNDMINHYNSNNRCTRPDDKSECVYSPLTVGKTMEQTEGCAIGRLFEPDSAKELDNFESGSLPGIIGDDKEKRIPEFFKTHVDFFYRLQQLHDLPYNWDEKGLSDSAHGEVRYITARFITNEEGH